MLLGGVGLAVAAACGSSGGSDDSGAAAGAGGNDGGATTDSVLIAFFNISGGAVASGIDQRITFGLGDSDGVVSDEVPPSLDFVIVSEAQNGEVATVTTAARGEGIPRPYYPVRFTVPAPGNYAAVTTVDGEQVSAAFAVSDPAQVPLVQPGEPLIPVDTPTVADARGVDPICTRDPQCPFHEVTLTEAIAEGRPIAFLLSTPEYCSTGICGPTLDVLIDQQAAYPDVRVVHAEIYADAGAVANLSEAQLAPAVDIYGLSFEPSLVLARADGTVSDRLDNIYDVSELDEGLAAITS